MKEHKKQMKRVKKRKEEIDNRRAHELILLDRKLKLKEINLQINRKRKNQIKIFYKIYKRIIFQITLSRRIIIMVSEYKEEREKKKLMQIEEQMVKSHRQSIASNLIKNYFRMNKELITLKIKSRNAEIILKLFHMTKLDTIMYRILKLRCQCNIFY